MPTREPPHGMPYPHSEPASSGFTAVNGEGHALSSFRPAEAPKSWRSLSGKDSPGENITVSTSLPTHGWRPDVREVTADYDTSKHASNSASKRKRSDTEDEVQPASADVDGLDSAKRRLMSNILDSAIDLTSPDADVDRRPLATGQTSRAPSPIPNINRGPPPPEVSSSAEARLVESARQFQQAQRAETVDQASPPYEHHERTEDQCNGDDHAQDDSADAKKRKRHFTNRTKTGCHTCRGRKKKCDEKKPLCANCERGGFACAGYGPKPPDYKVPGQSRTVMPQPQPQLQPPPQLQPSALSYPEQPPPGPTSHWAQGEGRHYLHQPPVETGRTYSHWGRLPEQTEPKRASSRDTWPQSSWQPDNSHPPPPPQGPYYPPERPPVPDYPNLSHNQHLPPLPPPQHHTSLPPPHLYPDPWAAHPAFAPFRHAPASVVSSNNIHLSSSSSGSRVITEKEKMFRGLPYLHCIDPQLIRDRERCVQALFNYNKAANPNEGTSADYRASFFTAILEPRKRLQADQKDHAGPVGEVGDCTLVEAPFKCDYGYHIHLGKEVLISADCYLQDGGGIWVGDRTIVGSGVQLLTTAASVDAKMRGGSKGRMKAGLIKIGDDVFIGAGATVLPYVTVGNGSVVGAGSVVTKDVPENTVVAGNPAKYVRSIDTNPANHRDHDINKQEEAMVKHMADYVDNGWKARSPRQ